MSDGRPAPRSRAQALSRAVAPSLSELSTPALVIDLDAVEHNVAAVLRRVGDCARWRPHVKTLKQPTLVGLMLDAGVHRFKAATPAEVQMVLQAAASRALPSPVDVLLAYPAAPPQLRAMMQLRRAHPHAHLGLLVDHPDHAAAVVEGIGQPTDPMLAFEMWLDVDLGMHRTGSSPAVWRNASIPASEWVRPMGLHGYDGHLSWSERERSAQGYDALVDLALAMPFTVEQIVTSGTHSYAHGLAHAPLAQGPWTHQVSPGTVVLSDRRSSDAAADLGLRQAAFVATRVLSQPGDDRITLDAGTKAIAPDCPPPGCAVLGEPHLEPLSASEEHRPVRVTEGPRPPRGSLLWLVPDHVCTTVNMHAEALYVRTDSIVGSAKIQARGHRPWLALGALALAVAAPSAACQPITTGIEVQLILPADDTDLQRTNNASVVLEPDGFTRSVVTDGLDFLLSFDVPPDATVRTLAVFLADDDTLLAWGRTPPFSYGGATGGLALLMARPGVLTPLDLGFSEADALALAAPVSDVGVLVMTQDGGGIFVDAYQLTLVTTASLDDPPAADDGMLVGAGDGGVVRVAWRDGLAAWRFDALDNSWTSLDLDGDLQARPGAGAWHDIESDTLWIVGGGEADDVLELPLLGTDARTVTAVEGLALDGPRREATATMLDGHLVVVGGDDPQLPLAWRADASEGAGEPMAWTASGCEQSADSPIRVLCLGGQRDGASTADAIELSIDTGALTAEVRTALLPAPIGDPQLFVDDRALYVEGDGRWVRIDRSDGTVTEPPGPAPRGTGGSTAPLPSGATLMVGGRDLDDAALEQWLVFGPDVTP